MRSQSESRCRAAAARCRQLNRVCRAASASGFRVSAFSRAPRPLMTTRPSSPRTKRRRAPSDSHRRSSQAGRCGPQERTDGVFGTWFDGCYTPKPPPPAGSVAGCRAGDVCRPSSTIDPVNLGGPHGPYGAACHVLGDRPLDRVVPADRRPHHLPASERREHVTVGQQRRTGVGPRSAALGGSNGRPRTKGPRRTYRWPTAAGTRPSGQARRTGPRGLGTCAP